MPVTIFCGYARKDRKWLNRIKSHLSLQQRQGIIEVWDDGHISPGTDWEMEIKEHLNTAQIILLLVSSDFMASSYCYDVEMQRALERHERGQARVIPIILRSVDWQGAPFGKLQALPTDGKPVTGPSWHDLDTALCDVASGIREVVEQLMASPLAPLSPVDLFMKRPPRRLRRTKYPKNLPLRTLAPTAYISSVAKARQKIEDLIREYKRIRWSDQPSWERARNFENVRLSMQEQAKRVRYTPLEITNFMQSLDEGDRLAGLAIRSVDPQNVDDFEQITNFVEKPRSPYEHFCVLQLIRNMKPYLGDQQLDKLRDAVRSHRYDRNADSEQWPAFRREIFLVA
jgi:hypothetical protein